MRTFLIIKSYTSSPVEPGKKYPIWHRVTTQKMNSPTDGRTHIAVMVEVSRNEAMSLVEKNGLVKAIENEHGVVYDTQTLSFLKKYKGLIYYKEEQQ